jgi:hypothetical protein
VFLPKIASNYKNISGNDFFFGGFGLLKYKKKENLIYRFGIYATSEAYGVYTTPILGWYYLSPNKNFEMDVSMPISADINYNLGFTTVGFDFFGIGRSYNLKNENQPNFYVDQSSIEFSAYTQFNLLNESILLRGKLGYATSNYEVYAANEKIDLGVPLIAFGDERTLLNPDISGGIFLKFEAIYRFHLNKQKN